MPFQRFSLSRNATSKRLGALKAVELRALAEGDRGAAVAALLADAEAEVLSLADRARPGRLDARDEQRRLGVAEPERRQTVELLREVERQRACRHDRVDRRERARGRRRRAPRRRGARTLPRTRSSCSSAIVRPAAARWPPKRSRCSAQAARPPWRSKSEIERPEPFQPSPLRGDEHDRPVEPLDEPRGDDPDHALVPALVPEDVAAPRAGVCSGHDSTVATASRRMRSSTPCRSRFSSSSVPASSRASRASSVSSSSSARSGRPSLPAALIRGASRNPTAVASTVAGIDARGRASAPEARVGSSARARGARRQRARGSRRRAGRRRRSSPARRGRGCVRGRVVVSEQRTGERVDDARAAELDARIVRRPRRDDRAVRQRLARAGGGR